jgi:glycosyltransferase involved in cell wall biosynthesis
MNIVVAIASHQRQKPLNIVLRCLPSDWHCVVVVTDQTDVQAIADRPNTHAFRHPNEPLGGKWQRAIDEARKLDPDFLIITGSDDVLLGETNALVERMSDHDMLVFTAWTIFDGRAHYDARYNELRPPHKPPIGGGRVYSRKLLDKIRWQLFDTHKRIHMDDYGWQNAIRNDAKVIAADAHAGIDIISLKGPWAQLNSFERLKGARHITITPLPNVRLRGDYQF